MEKFQYLVTDTSAFINNKALHEIAENVITIQDVINEIKSKRQIRRLVTLPYDVQVQDPDPEHVKFVIEFSKKSGDYLSLSSADIRVIAMTYQLEKKYVGVEHLRTEPAEKITVAKVPETAEQVNERLTAFFTPGSVVDADAAEVQTTDEQLDLVQEELETVEISVEPENTDDVMALENVASEEDTESDEDEDDEDNGEWITPNNIKTVKKNFNLDIHEDDIKPVACMTSDFAIQNVLKQIGLNVASPNGKIIKDMRTYILRCYTCFKTTSIMTKLFCPNCGNKTLKRVAVSIDENGKQVVHINFQRPLTSKGKNKSLPRLKGGKHSYNPILFEDQPLPKQMPTRVARSKTDALDEDYIAGYAPFVLRDVDSKYAILRGKGSAKQLLQNNSYENHRRFSKK